MTIGFSIYDIVGGANDIEQAQNNKGESGTIRKQLKNYEVTTTVFTDMVEELRNEENLKMWLQTWQSFI